MHYFDRQYHLPLKKYALKYKDGVGKIKGDITPAYSVLSRERIQFIKKIMPQLKVVFIMRNPVDRALSHALMDLVKQPTRSYNDFSEAAFINHFKSERWRSGGHYPQIIDNWQA